MGIGSVLMAAALALVVALFVGRPFLKGQLERREALSTREALLAQKVAHLEHIRALDFEHETGKMPDDEHQRQRAFLLQEAATILKELDELAVSQQGNGAVQPILRDVEADVEAAITAARRAPGVTETAQAPDSPARRAAQIEAAVSQLRSEPASSGPAPSRPAVPSSSAPQTGDRFCAQCGNPRDAGDKFCAACGFRFA